MYLIYENISFLMLRFFITPCALTKCFLSLHREEYSNQDVDRSHTCFLVKNIITMLLNICPPCTRRQELNCTRIFLSNYVK